MHTNIIFIIFYAGILFFSEIVYFKIAQYFQIVDKPNDRSSHKEITIRGGGIIFVIGLIFQFPFHNFQYPWFIGGLLLISIISFVDDVMAMGNKIRLLIHLVAVSMLFHQLNLFTLPWLYIILSIFFVIGTINAINFMDGINGITGSYGLVTLSSLLFINYDVNFTDSNLILYSIIPVLVFNFFNFRTRAKCFAGDVGSVGLAFILVFFLIQLLIKTQNVAYILLFLVYGLDVFTTMFFRLLRRENIMKAHRTHFYQFLANEKKLPHLIVALLYCIIQIIINCFLIAFPISMLSSLALLLLTLGTFIVILRFVCEGYKRLTKNRDTD